MSHTTQAKTKDNIKWVYGFKLHALVDAKYGVPLALSVTTGSRHDSQELSHLIEQAKESYEWLAPEFAVADRAYDSAAIHQTLYFHHRIKPIINIRRPSNAELYGGIYTRQGVPTCLGKVPMRYVGNKKGLRVYRCREGGCGLKDSTHGGVRHCDTVYRQDPSEDIRLFGVVRRDSRRW